MYAFVEWLSLIDLIWAFLGLNLILHASLQSSVRWIVFNICSTFASCEQMKRQQRKLNFLITQTELYAHFMARKLTGASDAEREAILHHFDEPATVKPQPLISGVVRTAVDDDYGVFLLLLLIYFP